MHARLFSRSDLRGRGEVIQFNRKGVHVRAVFSGPFLCVELRSKNDVHLVELSLAEWEALTEAWRRFCERIGL